MHCGIIKIFVEKNFFVGWIHTTKIVNTEIPFTTKFKDKALSDIGLDESLNEGDALNFLGHHSEVTVPHMDSLSHQMRFNMDSGPLTVENQLPPSVTHFRKERRGTIQSNVLSWRIWGQQRRSLVGSMLRLGRKLTRAFPCP